MYWVNLGPLPARPTPHTPRKRTAETDAPALLVRILGNPSCGTARHSSRVRVVR